MRNILHAYKLRLTNLSQSNRSLKLGRLSKRRDIDLFQLGFLNEASPEEMLAQVLAGKDLTLIPRLDPRHEPTNLADRRLTQIYREVRSLFEENGSYDLHLGYPFVEGKFVDGTIARCPVLLFPVELVRSLQSRPRWRLRQIKDEPVVFNPTFFLAYEQFQQERLAPGFWEEEIPFQDDWMEWLKGLYEKVKAYELLVNFNSALFERKLRPFQEYLASTMAHFPTGKLMFQPEAVLGLFPQSDSSLLQDYETLEKAPDDFPLFSLLEPEHLPQAEGARPQLPAYIKEENRYFVTPVDQSQEEALIQIKQGDSLVIYGPPGTGKSQVIVNLIADAMAHGHRVLLVSQKRAALDVVYKRLNALGLGRFAMLVHDVRHDRRRIFDKIKHQIDDIPAFKQELRDLNLTKWEHDFQLLSRQVDQLTRKFETLYEALAHPGEKGISLHELYLQTRQDLPILPLEDMARSWKMGDLQPFLDQLEQILPYREFWADPYPWRARKSFHDWDAETLRQVQALLSHIPQEWQLLHPQWAALDAQLGEPLLDLDANQRSIRQYRQWDAYVKTPGMIEAWEALRQDGRRVDLVASQLDRFDQAILALDPLQWLDDGCWDLYGTLVRHREVFNKYQDKAIRRVSIPYQQSRWFFQKLVTRKGGTWGKELFPALDRETELFVALHQVYAGEHAYAFTGDFPLLNTQAEKKAWVAQKRAALEGYRSIRQTGCLPVLQARFKGFAFDKVSWQQTMATVGELERFTQHARDQQTRWQAFLAPGMIRHLQQGITQPQAFLPSIQQLSASLSKDFYDLVALDQLVYRLNIQEKAAFDIVEAVSSPEDDPSLLLEQVRNSVYHHWIQGAEQQAPVLAEVSSRGFETQRQRYGQRLEERRERLTSLIQRRVIERIVENIEYNRLNNPVTYRQIHHQVSKKRKLWSVRKLVQQTWKEGLDLLTPCWMASPESTSAIFPMAADFFDLVIFDEASQCFVERALPVMLRGRQCIIAGDDQQLQPLDLYKVKYEEGIAWMDEDALALEVESVLDLAKTAFAPAHLRWHYRSEAAPLIHFSNLHFYEQRLQMMPLPAADPLNQPPLVWKQVNGTWDEHRNKAEAGYIVDLVEELVLRPDAPTLGIVTFNFHQREYIRDLLENRLQMLATSAPDRYQRLWENMNKTEEEEFQGLFVKNIENVQGDERDIIIFSVGYGYNLAGKFHAQFGLLNQRGGENRLNVAITRARKQVYVVASFEPEALNVGHTLHQGPKMLKAYLQYVKAVSEDRATGYFATGEQIQEESQHRMVRFLAASLEALGYTVDQRVGETAYQLDLAVKSRKDPHRYLLGIECEGPVYFRGRSAKAREIYRPALLAMKGWNLHRVWARNFWQDREREVQKIRERLESLEKA